MADSLEEKRKTDPQALREVSVSGEDMSTSGHYPTDFETFKVQLEDEINTETLNEVDPRTPYQLSESNINGIAVPTSVIKGTQDSEDVLSSFSEVKQSLLVNGYSGTLEDVKSDLASGNKARIVSAAQEMLLQPGLSETDINNILQVAGHAIERASEVNLEAEALEQLATSETAHILDINEVIESQEFILNGIDRIASSRQEIKEMYSKNLTDIDTDEIKVFTDSFFALLPFNESLSIDNLAEDLEKKGLLEVEGSLGLDFLTPGEVTRLLREKLRNLSGQERVDWAGAVMDSIRDNAGLLGGNSALQVQMLDSVFGSFLEEDPSWDEFDRWVTNAAGVLDVIGLGQGLKNSVQVFKQTSALRNVAAGSPKVEKELAKAVIDDKTGSTARVFNTTREEAIANYAYPKPRVKTKTGEVDIVPNMTPAIAKVDESVQEILDLTRSSPFNYAPELKTDPRLLVDSKLKAYADYESTALTSNSYRQAMSSVEYNPGSNLLDVQAVYGKTDTHGFSSVDSALEDAAERMPEHWKKGRIQALVRDGDSTKVVDNISEAGEGEYFYRLNYSVPLERGYVDTTGMFFDASNGNALPAYTTWLLSPDTYTPQLSRAGDRATDVTLGVAQKFAKIFNDEFVKKLNGKETRKVNDILARGAENNEVYSPGMLLSFDMTAKEIDAYYTARRISDAFWVLDNQRRYSKLDAMGMKHLYIDDIEFETFGIPLNSKMATGVTKAYDPRSGNVVDLTPGLVEDLYKSGHIVAKTESPMGDVQRATHILMRKQGDSSYKVDELPQHVLPYNNGHISRYYKENFFVKRDVTIDIDGTASKFSVARGASTLQADAQKLAEKLNKEAGKDVYHVELARELDEDTLSSFRDQVRPPGGPRFGRRGQHLESAGEALAKVAEPIESLIKTSNSIARNRGMGDLIEVAKEGWVKKYGKFAQTEGGRPVFPQTEDFFDKALSQEKGYEEALSNYRYIRNNLESAADNRDWKAAMLKLSAWIDSGEKGARRSLAEYVAENIGDNGNPVKLARSLAFYMFLATNPVRQAVLQTQQFAFIASINPKMALSSIKTKQALDLGMAFSANKTAMETINKIPEAYFKASGFSSKKEWLDTVKAFKESGLPFSIDQHSFARDAVHSLENAVTQGQMSRLTNRITRGATLLPRAAKRAGFDFGEYNNLSLTWLMARERFKKANGKLPTSRLDWDEVGADARQMALSMTPSGSFTYQQNGFASLLTQFLSIQHKAALAILPGRFGSKAFTSSEKAWIFIGQALVWGAAGFGLSEVYKNTRDAFGYDFQDRNPTIDQILAHGTAELVINNVLTELTGEKQDIALEGFAAAGGMYDTVFEWAKTLLVGQGTPLEIAPAWSAFSRLGRVTNILWHTVNVPEIESSERLERAISAVASYSSGGANYLKASAALRYGNFVDSSGDLVANATFTEAMAKGLIGLNTREMEEYYRIISSGPRSEIRRKALDDIATEMFEKTKTSVMLLSSKGSLESVNYDMLEEAMKTEMLIQTALDPNDAEEVGRIFRNKIMEDHGKNQKDSFLENLIRSAVNNRFGSDADSILTEVKNSGLIQTPGEEEQIRELIEFNLQHVQIEDDE